MECTHNNPLTFQTIMMGGELTNQFFSLVGEPGLFRCVGQIISDGFVLGVPGLLALLESGDVERMHSR